MKNNSVRIAFWMVLIFIAGLPVSGSALPLKSQILGPKNSPVGLAHIYIDYVELMELDGTAKGRVSFVKTQSGFELFVVRKDEKNEWTGRASNRRLYDVEGKLLAFYNVRKVNPHFSNRNLLPVPQDHYPRLLPFLR